jgi:co-chaperonin GroES (HSP10)
VKPLFARVLLERPKEEKIGSVLLPEESKKRLARLKCQVLAVGPNADPAIKVGQAVLIGRHAGDWINADGLPGIPDDTTKEFFIVQDEDILAVLE